MDITSLLTFASQSGASDVHLSSGEPPMIRLNGDMKKLDHPALTREQVHGMPSKRQVAAVSVAPFLSHTRPTPRVQP